MKPQRHRWGEKIRTEYETLQICMRPGCGVSKTTHHEVRLWTDYHRQGVKISDRAPPCEGEPSVSLKRQARRRVAADSAPAQPTSRDSAAASPFPITD